MTSTKDILPPAFVEKLVKIIPAEHQPQVFDSFNEADAFSFRVNTLRASTDTVYEQLTQAGIELTPSWYKNAFIVSAKQRRLLTESSCYQNNQIYIQNLSSMFPVLLLDPQADEWILDLAAAPGGKTSHIAALMNNQGKISAVEPVKPRFFKLKHNLEALGISNTKLYMKDGTRVWRNCPEQFDRIMLDAPCSSEARFNINAPDSFKYWSPKKNKEMSRKQIKLLFSAIQSLKPDGTLIYSTCAYSPEENEQVVNKALKTFGDAISIDTVDVPFENYQSGLTEWNDKQLNPQLQNCVRVLPDGVMSGFFVCKIGKLRSTISN